MRYASVKASGEIAYIMESSAALPMVLKDLFLVDGDVTPDTHWISNGQALKYNTINKLNLPRYMAEWDPANEVWIDRRTIVAIKDAQWEQVKLQRDNTEFSVFKFQGIYYDCDRVSQSRIQGAAQLASIALANNQTVVQEWTTADNSVVSLNATDLLNLGLQLGLFINKVHDYGRVLRARIDAADSSLDVQEVLWDEAEFNATLQ